MMLNNVVLKNQSFEIYDGRKKNDEMTNPDASLFSATAQAHFYDTSGLLVLQHLSCERGQYWKVIRKQSS